MRLQSYLSKAGIASRRKVVEHIEAGLVTVNGKKVLEPGFAVSPDKDEIKYKDHPVRFQRKAYYAFHKPRGVITTTVDTHGRKTILDFFKDVPGRLYPVGRLDQDTSGLLIVTNDGDFANEIMHPSHGKAKIYELTLKERLSESQRTKAEKGLWVEGYQTRPCRIEPIKKANSPLYLVTLYEGRKRQIREMMKIIQAEIVSLHRIQVGTLKLGHLKVGTYRPLTEEEIKALTE